MPNVEYILTMNDGTKRIVYSRCSVEELKGQYKKVVKKSILKGKPELL